MSDTQTPNIADASQAFVAARENLASAIKGIVANSTPEELRESALILEEMFLAMSMTAAANLELARLNHQRWSTALARATAQESHAIGWRTAYDGAVANGDALRAQAATDAATIANLRSDIDDLRAQLSASQCTIDSLRGSNSSEIPNSSPTATPPAALDGAPRFKVGDKVAKVYGDSRLAHDITAVDADGRYSISNPDGTRSIFKWNDDELMPFTADAANAQRAEMGGAQ